MDIREFLARELREQRRARGRTRAELAEAVGYSTRMIEAVEQGYRLMPPEFAEPADRFLGTNGLFGRLCGEVLEEGRAFPHLLQLEREAVDFRIFDMRLVPGLLQTPEYARAAIRAGDPAPPFDVEQRLTERMERQKVLAGLNPPRVRVVLDEAVLHRQIAGPNAQRDQLARLLEPGQVELQVLPFSVGNHGGIDGPIRIMSFADAPDAAHADGRGGGTLIDKPDEIAEVRRAFDRIIAAALPADRSAEMIRRVMEDLS